MASGRPSLRSGLRWVRAFGRELAGISARQRTRLDGSCAAVLMYHRVLPTEIARARAVEPGMYVTPRTFARQLKWLRREFRVLPLGELVDRLIAGRPLGPRAVALSFDDGWRDGLTYALPELARTGLPATVFLVSTRVGSCGAFWPDEVCRIASRIGKDQRARLARELGAKDAGQSLIDAVLAHLKAQSSVELERSLARIREIGERCAPGVTADGERELLDWDEVAEMARSGVEFESHGRTHAILTGLSAEAQADELRGSLEELRARGYARHALLAYPVGAHDPRVCRLAAEAGYRAAFTTEIGLVRPGLPLWQLPRIGLHEDVSSSRAEFHERVPGTAR